MAESVLNIVEMVKAAYDKWFATDGSPEEISKAVEALLNKRRDEITLAMLGLKQEFGKIEVMDRSIVDNYIRSHVEPAVMNAISANISKLTVPPTTDLEAIREQYQKSYRSQLEGELQKLAYRRAEEDAKRMIDDMGSDMRLIKKIIAELRENGTTSNKNNVEADFIAKSIISSAEIKQVVVVSPDGSLKEVDIRDPANSGVKFLVEIQDKVMNTGVTILTDGDKWWPLESRDGTLCIADEFKTCYKIFTVMGPADKRIIYDAITEYQNKITEYQNKK